MIETFPTGSESEQARNDLQRVFSQIASRHRDIQGEIHMLGFSFNLRLYVSTVFEVQYDMNKAYIRNTGDLHFIEPWKEPNADLLLHHHLQRHASLPLFVDSTTYGRITEFHPYLRQPEENRQVRYIQRRNNNIYIFY